MRAWLEIFLLLFLALAQEVPDKRLPRYKLEHAKWNFHYRMTPKTTANSKEDIVKKYFSNDHSVVLLSSLQMRQTYNQPH
jgi:hypothetical protein